MEQKQNKLKVLCLHGHQTNSQIMEMQTKEWRKFFKNEMEMEYMNGPHQLLQDEVIDVRVKKLFEHGLEAFTWLKFISSDYYENVISDLSHLAKHVNENGPYDGIIGFSQGGSILHTFLQLALEKKLEVNHLPKFVIYICSPLMGPALSIPQLDIPSIHYVSKEDTDLYDRQIITSVFYKNPIVLQHSFGHRVPRLSPHEVQIIKTFIKHATSYKSTINPTSLQQKPNL